MTTRLGAADFFSQNFPTATGDASDTSSVENNNSLQDYIDVNDALSCGRSLGSSIYKNNAIDSDNTDTLSVPSFCSDELTDSDSEYDSDYDGATCASGSSVCSMRSVPSVNVSVLDNDGQMRDSLSKTFLQLKGISVGNFNMNCNFRIESAIAIMLQYDLSILAIQEHTPWNRKLLENEILSIERNCEKYGFFVTISDLQIIIIDKQLKACHRNTVTYEEGRIISCRFELSDNNYITFIPVYGVPHVGGEKLHQQDIENSEDCRIQKLAKTQEYLKTALTCASKSNDIVYVFGDLQDTPDNSKRFHYGSCRFQKHPLGIVKTCEQANLSCSIYKFLDSMQMPVISRHGSKGGRFLDGMYTCTKGLDKLTGISIVTDTGVYSDHDLIITKMDLGIEPFVIDKSKEERIDFKRIMEIPVHIKPGDIHPTLNTSIYQGADFQNQASLYQDLQAITNDPDNNFMTRIIDIDSKLEDLENAIILRTKQSITPEEQRDGKLISRTIEDATAFNAASGEFFQLINDICRKADLASNVPILPASSIAAKKNDIISGKTIPGVTSIAISKQLEDATKRARYIMQRVHLTIRAIKGHQARSQSKRPITEKHQLKCQAKITLNLKRFSGQQEAFVESLEKTIAICQQVAQERQSHINAIEMARNKKIYDSKNEYIETVIANEGKAEYDNFIYEMKKDILGREKVAGLDTTSAPTPTKLMKLRQLCDKWQDITKNLPDTLSLVSSRTAIKNGYTLARSAKKNIKTIIKTLQDIRREEGSNSKNHLIRIGKYGSIARIISPKERKGPTANSFYPTKTGEPMRKTFTNAERVEATIQTHKLWMSDPPGQKNCHFLDIQSDEVGPNGVKVLPDKLFDDDAEWKYLEGALREKVSDETADRIRLAHKKLPELFRHIRTETKLTYPFKYDCVTGDYLYSELEDNLRKNAAQGNGKARATGFAIPVLGRLPKIFLDVYLRKCRIQMALRLLDVGTECSLRICIGKPCGGVRPLTVGHDDNVFLNGLAQQAIQKEIARLNLMPENVCSYQKGKGCADATIVDSIIKEIALQNNDRYLAELDDDAEKMFDRLYLELQTVLLLLAGAGMQGFTEWQSANMVNRTNKIITDIFVALLDYKCGLPQGSGFSVEIANLYAMFLLMWWNMDPINPTGTIAPFTSPRHGFPLIAGGIHKLVSSLAYVDDAKRFVSVSKDEATVEEFFEIVQGYCNLLADLSLVIKMGRNVRKCTVYLYNIPEDTPIPEFTSIAWSYDAQGPVKGVIAVVVVRRDAEGHLICYDVPQTLRKDMPAEIQATLALRKYLGVATNAQLDATEGKEKIISKMAQRIGFVSNKSDSIQEAQIAHNMLVCQVATFSPICISMTLKECTAIDRHLVTSYQYRLKYTPSDARHSVFITRKKGGYGVRSFTSEYVGALLRDLEVYISNSDSLPAHALLASIEAATNKCLWKLFQAGKIPEGTHAATQIGLISINGMKTSFYVDDPSEPQAQVISHDFTHTMEKAVTTTSYYGFMLRDLNYEFASRFIDELLLQDNNAKAIGSPAIRTRATLGACIGEGNRNFLKYSMFGRVYLLLRMIIDEAQFSHNTATVGLTDEQVHATITSRAFYKRLDAFPKEIAAEKLASTATKCLKKFQTDFAIGSFIYLVEWRCYTEALSSHFLQKPRSQDYRILITEDDVFQPSCLHTMHQNSIALSGHLQSLLCLNAEESDSDDIDVDIDSDSESNRPLSNEEIIYHATRHELPIFVSMDGGFEQEIATVSITIVAPDIRDFDEANEWQDRPAKVLLVRSWRLPSKWGTGAASINMAEAFGFILAAYTIPIHLPVIYITDSNNARTLQRKIRHSDTITHRKKIREVYQGIDSSIAQHIAYLTEQWPSDDQLSEHTLETYKRGEEICAFWASREKSLPCALNDTPSARIQVACDDSDSFCSSGSSSDEEDNLQMPNGKNRYQFNSSMYDFFGRVNILTSAQRRFYGQGSRKTTKPECLCGICEPICG